MLYGWIQRVLLYAGRGNAIHMNTIQHGFWIYVLARKHPRVYQFVFGAVFPDLVYFAGFLCLLYTEQIPWKTYTFGVNPAVGISYLRSLPWVGWIEFAGHSAVIWLAVSAASLIPAFRNLRAFILGWGSHLLIDTFTHVQYAPYLLYPFSWVQYPIGVSYWDIQYHGKEFQWVQGVLTFLATIYLVYEYYMRRRKKC
jgi:hypothetical protein